MSAFLLAVGHSVLSRVLTSLTYISPFLAMPEKGGNLTNRTANRVPLLTPAKLADVGAECALSGRRLVSRLDRLSDDISADKTSLDAVTPATATRLRVRATTVPRAKRRLPAVARRPVPAIPDRDNLVAPWDASSTAASLRAAALARNDACGRLVYRSSLSNAPALPG